MQHYEPPSTGSVGRIACCECGTPIEPNSANMCVGCLRSKVDITEGLVRQSQLYSCRNCSRYFSPPNHWTPATLESKELMAVCLKRLKPSLASGKVRLVDATFIWTEPHSKRVKVRLTVQKEVLAGAVLQQAYVVEFTCYNQMCESCHRFEAKDYWRACVQLRQKCDHKRTLFYVEQLLLKYNVLTGAGRPNVKPAPTGIDFFFAKQQDARKLVEFLQQQLPCRHHYSQQLVTHDPKSNIYDYKHTFCVELVPITKDCLICLPKRVAQRMGNLSQFALCLRVTNQVAIIDPATAQLHELNATAYYKEPFEILCQPSVLQEFFVMEVEEVAGVGEQHLGAGHGRLSKRHQLADVWVVRADRVGAVDAPTYSCRTHLGKWLAPGDVVLGYDLSHANFNNAEFDAVPEERRPNVVLVKKHFGDRGRRAKQRQWKLKRLLASGEEETASVQNEFMGFMEDLEEDAVMRERINIYKKDPAQKRRGGDVGRGKPKGHDRRISSSGTTDGEEAIELPEGPTIEEMLDDLQLTDNEEEEDVPSGGGIAGEEGEVGSGGAGPSHDDVEMGN